MNLALDWAWKGRNLTIDVIGNQVVIRNWHGLRVAVATMYNGHMNNAADVCWPLDPNDWHWQASADQAIRDAALRGLWP